MRPHLVSDLRLLWLALKQGSSKEQLLTPPSEPEHLLAEVLERVTQLAHEVLHGLCREQGADQVATIESSCSALPSLELMRSPIAVADAPLGIRSLGPLAPGSLVGFYPGRIFQPEEPLPKSDMLYSSEFGEVYIDGKGWLPLHWKDHPLLQETPMALWHGNRLAIGNLLNHPPRGTLPNCVPMAFCWPTWEQLQLRTPAHWARLLPHVEVQQGQVTRTPSGVRNAGEEKLWFPPWPYLGAALVAVRRVQPQEELFWNYRLHPRPDSKDSKSYPSWYTPVNDEHFEAVVQEEASHTRRT